MNYPTALQSLSTGTRMSVDAISQRDKTGQAALLDAAQPKFADGELHRRWHLDYYDPLDSAHTLGQSFGWISDVEHDGDGHGGAALRVDGDMPEVTTVTQAKARTSIY